MDFFLGSLLQAVFDKLASPILGEIYSRKDFKKEIQNLQDLLPTIQAVIADAQTRTSGSVQIWLRKLRDVAYDADDLLDELTIKALQKQMKNKVLISSLKPFASYFTASRKLKDIRVRFDDIAREMSDFQFRDAAVCRPYWTAERGQTGPYLDEFQVLGRENDVERIVEMLVVSPSSYPRGSDNISVIPIVAMGGMGKTTLAQLAYNDPRVEQHFNLKIWISGSNNFNVRKLITDILDYTTKGIRQLQEHSQLGVLQTQLQESLRGNRYLIVLDDVWNRNEDEWNKLRIPLRCGADGSKILVTTRSESVAQQIMGTMTPYLLEPLAHDDCWTLFQQHAFAEGEEEAYPNLVCIGKEIVYTCGGVPLAVKILGSMMRSKRAEREWSNVRTSLGMGGLLWTVRLSYNCLHPHVKPCFAYLSVFPKNHLINKEKLIHQWIAEGLIQSPGDAISSKKMEDTANDYFNDLMSMSFFQSVTKCDDADGVITEFKLHNLIHDLAEDIAGTDVLRMTDDSSYVEETVTTDALHASLECSSHTSQNIQAFLSAEKLGTVNVFPVWPRGELVDQIVALITSHQRRLRGLSLGGCDIGKLHNSIGGLIHLRYLDLSNTRISTLPKTICRLFNLQTLNLSGCKNLKELPSGISNLINLRHLNIKDCTSLTHMPGNIRNLRNLQTLPFFIIGLTLEESLFQLVDLDLRGELEVKCLENIRNIKPDLCLAYKQLHSLGLSWGSEIEGKSDSHSSRQTAEINHGQNAVDVLACLQPNPNLRKLSISEYSGEVFPPWMNHVMLPNLTKLVLINCRRCENLPTLGQLPFLKVLNMQGMEAVIKISSEFYGKNGKREPFQSLNELNLRDFPKLRTWESMDGAESFPCLNRLTITKCSKLSNMPWFPSLQHLELHECNAMILRSANELNSLFTLVIDNFPELNCLPKPLLQNNSLLTSLTVSSCPRIASMPANLGNLKALRSLAIRWCEELETLPDELRNLTSLQTLEIVECGSLISLPEEGIKGLKSLRSFSIENCSNLTSLPMALKHLKALELLTIMYCPSLVCLPDGLQHISTLRSLTIVSCPELVSLPEGLQHVKMLQNLEIRSCTKLVELPEWVGNFLSLRSLAISDCHCIKSFPEGLKHLTALQHLSIGECPDLEERCHKERGEDWHKISHIPHLYVGLSALQQRQDGATSSSS